MVRMPPCLLSEPETPMCTSGSAALLLSTPCPSGAAAPASLLASWSIRSGWEERDRGPGVVPGSHTEWGGLDEDPLCGIIPLENPQGCSSWSWCGQSRGFAKHRRGFGGLLKLVGACLMGQILLGPGASCHWVALCQAGEGDSGEEADLLLPSRLHRQEGAACALLSYFSAFIVPEPCYLKPSWRR